MKKVEQLLLFEAEHGTGGTRLIETSGGEIGCHFRRPPWRRSSSPAVYATGPNRRPTIAVETKINGFSLSDPAFLCALKPNMDAVSAHECVPTTPRTHSRSTPY